MKKLTLLFSAIALTLSFACSSSESGDDPNNPNPNPDPSGPDAGDRPDPMGTPDAGTVNAACDYTEQNDSGNDIIAGGASEATALEFTEAGGEIVLCGRIDPANQIPDAGIADVDFFDFAVGGAQDAQIPFRITLTAPGGDQLSDLGLQLSFLPGAGQDPITVTSAFYENGYALATNNIFIPGDFQFLVLSGNDPLPTAPIDYEIHISVAPPCDTKAGDATFAETESDLLAQQGPPDNRANDMVQAAFAAEPVTSATGRADDSPEPTGLTLAAGAPVKLAGQSADEQADGDEYLDRDSYLVATDATVNELDIRLSWPDGDVDMDLMSFLADQAGVELSDFAGAMIGTDDDEFFTVRVSPSSNLWIWAATYDDSGAGGDTSLPANYEITICPRSYTP